MIFASDTGTTNLYNIGSLVFFILGSLTYLLTYLRASVNKSNRDLDQDTISTLKENNEALTTDRDGWKERALTAEGKNIVLQNTVTAAPEIAKLATVTAQQHQESTKLQKDLIKEFKAFVTSHERLMKEYQNAKPRS